MGTHRLRRTLARVSVVSLCAAGVIPLSSGAAHAAPPAPRLFDGTAFGYPNPVPFAKICADFETEAGEQMDNIPSEEEQAEFAKDNEVTVQFDDAPVPPLGAVSSLPLVGDITGPPLLFGLAGFLLDLELVDQVTALDVSVPSSESDFIIAGDGDNVILGGAGDDYICGNVGADIIDAGSGNDEIIGNSGEDVILGGSGDDIAKTEPDILFCFLGSGENVGC